MTQPLTRDLSATVAALEITEAELMFQATRLAGRAAPSSVQEQEHLADLTNGYTDGAKYVRILLNYHKGRMSNTQGRAMPGSSTVDQSGRGRAYAGDES